MARELTALGFTAGALKGGVEALKALGEGGAAGQVGLEPSDAGV